LVLALGSTLFSLLDFIEKSKELRYVGRTSQFALAGAMLALLDAGFELETTHERKGQTNYHVKGVDERRIGAIIGAGGENMDLCEQYHKKFLEYRGPKRISPFALPYVIVSSVPALVAGKFGIKGKSLAVSSACASSTHAIMEAYLEISAGRADVMVTGGADACITPYVFAGFDALGAMSKRNDEPAKASRPFDRDRDGFVMGEGAGIVVIEELNHALNRGAHIYCEITGMGATSDAYHIAAPHEGGESLAKAIKDAMDMAGMGPGEVDYINAHGTSTPANDSVESLAIKMVLGKQAYKVPVSSTKSMIGHLIGGAGGIELIATALTIERGMIHPTINLENPGEGCDLDYVPQKAIQRPVANALTINAGFGGFNAVLALKRYDG